MLTWSLIFLAVALGAAFLGFSAAAGTAALLAKVLFTLFLALFFASMIFGRRTS